MHQFLTNLGRKCIIVNLDYANDSLTYNVGIDVRELITIEVDIVRSPSIAITFHL